MEFICDIKKEEYISFAKKFKYTHFLQSYEWGVVSKTRGLIPFYVGLKDKNKIICEALLLQKTLPLGYSYFYVPRGFLIDYNDKELLSKFTYEVKKFCKSKKGIFFRIDPDIKLHTIDENAKKIEGEDNYELVKYLNSLGYKRKKLTYYFETMQPRFTFRISLKDDLSGIEKRYSKTTLQRIKKAENIGVYVEKGTIDDLKYFVKLMKMTEKRQNFFSHEEKFYYDFFKEFKDNVTLYLGKINISKIEKNIKDKTNKLKDELKLLDDNKSKKANSRKKEIEKELDGLNKSLEFYKDKPKEELVASSYIIVEYGNKAWALYAANDMDYKTLYPNYLVYKNQIKDAKEKGLEIFDVFGTIGKPNDNSNLVGLHDFKKKWGGEYIEFIGEFDYVLNKPMYLVYTKLIPIRHKIVNKLLRKKVK